jgi:hypothetical protein
LGRDGGELLAEKSLEGFHHPGDDVGRKFRVRHGVDVARLRFGVGSRRRPGRFHFRQQGVELPAEIGVEVVHPPDEAIPIGTGGTGTTRRRIAGRTVAAADRSASTTLAARTTVPLDLTERRIHPCRGKQIQPGRHHPTPSGLSPGFPSPVTLAAVRPVRTATPARWIS